MDRSACQRELAISCAALRRNIRPGYCVFRKHFSRCSPPSSSGENADDSRKDAAWCISARESRWKESMKRCLLQVAISLNCAMCLFGQTKPAADLIIQNARIWTVDPSRTEADAVAILGDRIVAVGSSPQVDAWRGSHTRVIDAAGKRLLPGF